MNKRTVSIGAKDFDIKLDGEFAEYFDACFKESFGTNQKIQTKELLWAFVQKCYDTYLQNAELKKLLEKLEKL
ncbi:MAG: hypothetical protein IBX44_00610 [Sulfurospirillum sp.]|nr:hypothetical protein [Sulfurospirillum sp.]